MTGRTEDLEWRRVESEATQPIEILMAEHKIILENLEELRKIVGQAKVANSFDELAGQLDRLRGIAHLLLDTESHHQREEKALFPRLERHGVTGPPQVMRLEHEELRARKRRLSELLERVESTIYKEFVKELSEIGGYIVNILRDHIFKEDNILYPAALKILKPQEWPEVLAEFEEIGYSSFTPGKR